MLLIYPFRCLSLWEGFAVTSFSFAVGSPVSVHRYQFHSTDEVTGSHCWTVGHAGGLQPSTQSWAPALKVISLRVRALALPFTCPLTTGELLISHGLIFQCWAQWRWVQGNCRRRLILAALLLSQDCVKADRKHGKLGMHWAWANVGCSALPTYMANAACPWNAFAQLALLYGKSSWV